MSNDAVTQLTAIEIPIIQVYNIISTVKQATKPFG